MKMREAIILVFIILHVTLLNAQNSSFSEQLAFSNYLLKNKYWDDSKVFIKYYSSDSALSNDQKDSLYLYAGKVYYKTEVFDTASFYYKKVNNNSPLYKEAALYSSFSLAENHNFNESRISFASLAPSDEYNREFLNFELLGANLLARDTTLYSEIIKTFTYSDKNFSMEELSLIKIKQDIEKINHKSGLLAGCMSAVIPGLGKIYAGKTRQGLTSFIPVALMGIQAFEAYKISGIKSVRFFLSAGLFSVFYIGNIWGSILSVSVQRAEINDEINNQILFNMRIPLQRISGKI